MIALHELESAYDGLFIQAPGSRFEGGCLNVNREHLPVVSHLTAEEDGIVSVASCGINTEVSWLEKLPHKGLSDVGSYEGNRVHLEKKANVDIRFDGSISDQVSDQGPSEVRAVQDAF